MNIYQTITQYKLNVNNLYVTNIYLQNRTIPWVAIWGMNWRETRSCLIQIQNGNRNKGEFSPRCNFCHSVAPPRLGIFTAIREETREELKRPRSAWLGLLSDSECERERAILRLPVPEGTWYGCLWHHAGLEASWGIKLRKWVRGCISYPRSIHRLEKMQGLRVGPLFFLWRVKHHLRLSLEGCLENCHSLTGLHLIQVPIHQ